MIVRLATDLSDDERALAEQTRAALAHDAIAGGRDGVVIFGARDPYLVRPGDPQPRILVLMARHAHLGGIEAAQVRLADVLVLLSRDEARACRDAGIHDVPAVLCDTHAEGPLAPSSPRDRIASARALTQSPQLAAALGRAKRTTLVANAIDSIVRAIREAIVLSASE